MHKIDRLSLFKDPIQSFCNMLRPIIKTEIMVINKDLVALAGTGQYIKNIGTRRPRDSYVEMSILSGESYKIEAPTETNQCLRCEIRSICPYSSVISSPIKYHGEIVGLFGFLGYNYDQRKIMLDRANSLARLSDEIAELLVNIFFEKESFHENCIDSQEMDRVISSIDEGIIITDHNNQIININRFAEKLLQFKKKELLGKPLTLLKNELKFNGLNFKELNQETNKKAKFSAFATPIQPDCSMGGYTIVFSRKSEVKNIKKRNNFTTTFSPHDLIGHSSAVLKLKNIIKRIAKNNSTILITGETGSGKELAVRLIHHESMRRLDPFIAINCGAIPDTLFESELFGYEEGAFTGARKNGKTGKFEMANGGTLFLDEIGYLTLTAQSKILRFLEDNIIEKIGGQISKKIDVRIIAATNKDLKKMVQEKSFLEDLYYRLNVIPLHIPPLRERIEDIPILLHYFISKINERFEGSINGFNSNTLNRLIAYHWPGNVRELKNVVEYVCNIKNDGLIQLSDLPPYLLEEDHNLDQDGNVIAQAEKILIDEAMRKFGNSTKGKKEAAKYLGISITTLYRRLGIYSCSTSNHQASR